VIEIRCLHDLALAEPLRGAMDALNLASSRPDPFSTLAYYRHYLRTAAPARPGTPMRPWLLLAFRGDELLGYLALKQATHRVLGLRAIKLDLLAAHTADRPHLVARPGEAAAVAAAMYAHLLGRRREWSLLEFQQQDAGAALQQPPEARGCRIRSWPDSDSATIPIRWSSLAAYFAALPKKARSNISRQMRTLLAAGDVQLLTASEPATRAALFELFRGVEARSWKAGTTAGVAGAGRWEDYYAGLMDPAAPMPVTVQVLLLDGVPAAGLISGAFDGGLYALHIVHDERLAPLAPGSAMLLMGLRLAIEGRFAFLNLLRGSGYYKARWLAQLIATRSVQVYRVGSPFHWRRALGDLARRLSAPWTATGPVLSNPVHRALRAAAPIADPRAATRPDERLRYARAVQAALDGQGEFLSAAQLAAVLPFDSRRQAPATDG
jgi:CelD/BcsL family acetyltransferase involved in cellulose biosynthesis